MIATVLATALATVLALVVAVLPVAPAGAQVAPPPSVWPQSPNASPRIEGHPNGLRISGPDRFSTSLALALTLRGTGGYPFSTPDRSLGSANGLETSSAWWGVGACPRAVIVVAGDSPADALAASALSDPTDQSTEPYLQRTAAADPLFDVPGGFARVDTDSAPILVTPSARQGATGLAVATRIAAQDLAAGGCTTARQAIVVGGPAAVPPAVDDELVAIGYSEVFRVSGPTRYGTAALVARSLGTAPVPPAASGCVDPEGDDGDSRMGFYANSVIEWRPSATECQVLGRTVVLADGVTGADALAAGWWTSFWQVPVLLHDGADSLPAATVEALETMQVDHLVVLGGVSRLSSEVADQARALTGAEVMRVSGADRYSTSVEMARYFGGWWPTGDGADFEGSMVCLAASSGEGGTAKGWPDALSAGPWCGAASGAAANPGAPTRALLPVAGAHPRTSAGGPARPARDAVPVLLVPVGEATLPPSVSSLLSGAFPAGASTTWCSSESAGACVGPGFVVAVGGATVVTDEVLADASGLVSGRPTAAGAEALRRDPMFHTQLDMAPVFGRHGTGPHSVCATRDGYEGARWLAVYAGTTASVLTAAGDVMLGGRYVADADGTVRSPGTGAPTCVAFSALPQPGVTLQAVSPTGRASAPATISLAPANRLWLTGLVSRDEPQAASGMDSDLDPATGGQTIRTFVGVGPGVEVTSRGETAGVTHAAVTVTINRGTDTPSRIGPDRFTATWSLTTPAGAVTGTAEGEAILVDGVWELRGVSTFVGGDWNVASGRGGFWAQLDTGAPGTSADDTIAWQIDGLVAG